MIDINAIGHRIADEIETKGHWQGGLEIGDGDGTPCCIVTSDTYFYRSTDYEKDAFMEALCAKLGIEDGTGDDVAASAVYRWNDETPTAEVLATLRNLP